MTEEQRQQAVNALAAMIASWLRRRAHDSQNGLPVATAARDAAAHNGDSPAEAVWWLHRHPGRRLRLADLAAVVTDTRHTAA